MSLCGFTIERTFSTAKIVLEVPCEIELLYQGLDVRGKGGEFVSYNL